MRLLLVEDEKELSQAVKRVLVANQYEVDAVYDGLQALDYLAAQKYDCVIMDIMMPRLDGLSALARMRAKGDSTPVLMLTAKAELDDRVAGLDAGADDYLAKPFALKELLARIRALTRRKGDITQPYALGNMTLNPDTYELSAQSSVHLTNKEFALLELLIRNKNMYLSTEKILIEVWDYDTEAEINVVWVFISSLRKKMEAVGADYTIKAARGVGYRLEAIHG